MEWIIPTASSYANDIDNVIVTIGVLTGFWFLIAEGVFFWMLWKFRYKEGRKSLYITGEKKEEMKWIHIPHNLILLCDLVVIAIAVKVWYDVKQDLPKPSDFPKEDGVAAEVETIRVIGQQWSWRIVHPGLDKKLGTADDIETVDEIRLKKGTVYYYKLQSTDVMHSFSVPVFRLKQDAVPGRTITGWFLPTKEGEYDLQCAEMCGIGHGIMNGRVFVQSPAAHEAWLKTQKPLGNTAQAPAAAPEKKTGSG